MKLGMCGFTIGAAAYYCEFPVVEVQQTFYDPPPPSTLRRWRQDAPADFEFTIKAWQVITHLGTSRTYRRLRSDFPETARQEAGGFRLNDTVYAAWLTTLDCAETLRATGILFQCPASFRETSENIAAMRAFFAAIDRPAGVRLYWEPRGPWSDEAVTLLCRDLGILHAVDPFVRPSLTPEVPYWRLHGNVSSYASYTDAELRQLRSWLPHDDRDGYILFNNIPRVKDIRRFREIAPARARADDVRAISADEV
jgi:uncharacterized protein YecE (DUF72 family)